MRNLVYKERSVLATILISVIVIALFLFNGYRASEIIKARSMRRMEEGVNTVVDEVVAKLQRDSRILNATADIISSVDNFDEAATLETMKTIAPLLETMDICVLTQDNRILQIDGDLLETSGQIDFEEEAAKGEHVSNRAISINSDNVMVLRHFVPIVQDGRTVALLYGRTRLAELPEIMNIDNIYNANADVYIIDTETEELIMDTGSEDLGTLDEFNGVEVRGGSSWEEVRNSIKKQESGYIVFRGLESEGWHNFYYMPAGINKWVVAVSVPERESLDSLYQMRKVFNFTGALILISVILYYFWIQRNAKKSMEQAVNRAMLEEKLHKSELAQKAKTTFLSNMSHDIRTPMNAIIGFATLAKNNIENKDRVQEYMDKILSSGNYLLSLINDVLDMSRIESGKLNIEEKPCTISDIFRDMRNIIQTQMQSKQLAFFMDTIDVVDEDVCCDKLHINQMLLNLLSNAIKFTPAGGAVFLTIRQKDEAPFGYGSYEIRVKDTGIGMSQEFVEHIFEPFERERTSTVSGIQGTGLGMAITKSIVDAMNGTIQVISKEGRGSEFIISLDLRLQSEHKQIEESEILKGKKALVVDDNFSTCDSMTKMLTQLGLDATWTMHGREAVLRARQAVEMEEDFFAYIIDWALPDLSGLEVVRQVKSIVGEDALIIVMTAYEWSEFEDEAREAGVNAFCNKPVFLSELKELLENAAGEVSEADSVSDMPEQQVDLSGKRLLIVEDNELNREIAQEMLAEYGFETETAEDGSIALDKISAADAGYYDLILMDIQMPFMDGHDATRAIRALSDNEKASVPIVAMTANAFAEDRAKALQAGMNDYVAKPINVEELLGVIRKILDK